MVTCYSAPSGLQSVWKLITQARSWAEARRGREGSRQLLGQACKSRRWAGVHPAQACAALLRTPWLLSPPLPAHRGIAFHAPWPLHTLPVSRLSLPRWSFSLASCFLASNSIFLHLSPLSMTFSLCLSFLVSQATSLPSTPLAPWLAGFFTTYLPGSDLLFHHLATQPAGLASPRSCRCLGMHVCTGAAEGAITTPHVPESPLPLPPHRADLPGVGSLGATTTPPQHAQGLLPPTPEFQPLCPSTSPSLGHCLGLLSTLPLRTSSYRSN